MRYWEVVDDNGVIIAAGLEKQTEAGEEDGKLFNESSARDSRRSMSQDDIPAG